MVFSLSNSWQNILSEEFEKPYFEQLISFVKTEYLSKKCYPNETQIFAAFDHCPFEKIKVVLIGQDPYHGFGQANGLCFSVIDGVPFPPSLINIFKEIESDLQLPYPKSGNLERWADQGVLLLNATLTVRESEAGSHQKKGWETFTDAVIQKISEEKENVVFLNYKKAAVTNYFPSGATIVKRSIFYRHGLFEEDIFAFEDYEYAIRGLCKKDELQAYVCNNITLFHDHRYQVSRKDKEAVKERYNEERLHNSFNFIQEKHGVIFDHDWKWWSKKQMTEMTEKTFLQKVKQLLRKYF